MDGGLDETCLTVASGQMGWFTVFITTPCFSVEKDETFCIGHSSSDHTDQKI